MSYLLYHISKLSMLPLVILY